jgi:hypothetical protein
LARLLAGLTAQLLFAKAPAMEQLLVRLAAVDHNAHVVSDDLEQRSSDLAFKNFLTTGGHESAV